MRLEFVFGYRFREKPVGLGRELSRYLAAQVRDGFRVEDLEYGGSDRDSDEVIAIRHSESGHTCAPIVLRYQSEEGLLLAEVTIDRLALKAFDPVLDPAKADLEHVKYHRKVDEFFRNWGLQPVAVF